MRADADAQTTGKLHPQTSPKGNAEKTGDSNANSATISCRTAQWKPKTDELPIRFVVQQLKKAQLSFASNSFNGAIQSGTAGFDSRINC
jgi:hypothetical protein